MVCICPKGPPNDIPVPQHYLKREHAPSPGIRAPPPAGGLGILPLQREVSQTLSSDPASVKMQSSSVQNP
eukprot:366051-Chlamydomonas_euryale.AAC.7